MQLGMVIAGIIAAVVLRTSYGKINARRDGKSEQEIREKYSEEDLLIMGDKSPLYRYVA